MPKRVIAFDTETTGLYRWSGGKMFCFSTCDGAGRKQALLLGGTGNRKLLRELWNRPDVELVGHNMKFDMGMVKHAGISIPYRKRVHDTSILSHVMQNDHPSHKLKPLAWELCGYSQDDEERVKRETRGCDGDYSQASWEAVEEYAANDAERTMILFKLWKPMVDASPQLTEIYDTECDLLWTTLRLEERGVTVRPEELDRLLADMDAQVEADVATIRKYVPNANPNAPEDIATALFSVAKLPVLAVTAKTKSPSTDKETLMELARTYPDHELLPAVLRFRSYSRGRTNFEQYRELMDSEGRIHPNVNTCGAKTNRESAEHPNLQNVAKSKALLNPYPVPARRVFRPAEGYVNYHGDYAGEEMRLMVAACGDQHMLECITNKEDPHAYSARMFYGRKFTDADEKTARTLRNAAKNGAFGRCYGAGLRTMATTLGLSLEDAREGCARWDGEFPVLANLASETAAMVESRGYVETLFGRKLHLGDSAKAYAGLNYRIQGNGAELIKRAQNRVDRFLHDHTADEVGILLPVHDELIIQVPRTRMKDAYDLLRTITKLMTDFPQVIVPLEIEWKVSTYSWEKQKGVNLDGQ